MFTRTTQLPNEDLLLLLFFLWRLANQFNDALPPPTGLECVNQEILELNLKKKILLAKSVSLRNLNKVINVTGCFP